MRLAVIPARGGSKRIPRKNIKDFLGKPIIAYSIEAALDSGCFDQVIVSTDDAGIAGVARACGAETPFVRPPALADDFTGTNAVVKHALGWFQAEGVTFDTACCIYATAPFLRPQDLKRGCDLLESGDKQFAFSVTTYDYPIQRALRISAQSGLQMMYPEFSETRSQDLEAVCHDAGQFYWGRAQAFLNDLPLFASHSLPVPLPRHLVQDIDTPEDWFTAELMYKVSKSLE